MKRGRFLYVRHFISYKPYCKPAWCEEGFSICPRLHTLQTIYFLHQHDAKKVLVYVTDCTPLMMTSLVIYWWRHWSSCGDVTGPQLMTLPLDNWSRPVVTSSIFWWRHYWSRIGWRELRLKISPFLVYTSPIWYQQWSYRLSLLASCWWWWIIDAVDTTSCRTQFHNVAIPRQYWIGINIWD